MQSGVGINGVCIPHLGVRGPSTSPCARPGPPRPSGAGGGARASCSRARGWTPERRAPAQEGALDPRLFRRPLLTAVARRPMLPGAYAESDHASSAAHRRAVYYSRRVGQERSQVVGARDRVLLCFCRRRDDGVELGVKFRRREEYVAASDELPKLPV